MKGKKIVSIFACSFLLAGGTVAAVCVADGGILSVRAAVTVDPIEITSMHDATASNFYVVAKAENDIPDNWDDAYQPVASGAVFLNGSDISSTVQIKKPGVKDYFFEFLGAKPTVAGDVVEFKAGVTWSGTSGSETYEFSFKPFARQWDGTKYINVQVDAGQVKFVGTHDETASNCYIIADDTNEIPVNWDDAYSPVGTGCAFLDGVDVSDQVRMKKPGAKDYFFEGITPTESQILHLTGTWKGTSGDYDYTFQVEDFYRQWTGSAWGYVNMNLGELEITQTLNGCTASVLNLYIPVDNDIPNNWDDVYKPVSAGAVTLNGVDISNQVQLKKPGVHDYYLELGTTADEGDVLVIKGSWAGRSGEYIYNFTLKQFRKEWDGSAWDVVNVDVGELTITQTLNGCTNDVLNLYIPVDNDIPNNWDDAYYPTVAGSVLLNNVDISASVTLKKPGVNDYFLSGVDADEGDILTIKGTWAGTSGDAKYHFTLAQFRKQWNGTAWQTINHGVGELEIVQPLSGGATSLSLYIPVDNVIPNNWDDAYLPTSAEAVMLGEDDITNSVSLKKPGEHDYYLEGFEAEEGDILTIKGNWSGQSGDVIYNFSFGEFSARFNGSIWQNLAQYKTSAKDVLDTYLDPNNYREEQWDYAEQIIVNGKDNIEVCVSFDDVDQMLDNFKGHLDAIKTDAQLDAEEAETVDNRILSIGVVTLQCEDLIAECRALYNALDDGGKALVTQYAVLQAAEARLAELKQAKLDAEAFDAMVNAIGEVTLEKETQIRAAQNARDELSQDAKEMITTGSLLDSKVNRLDYLKREKAKAENVEALIAAIPNLTRTNYDEDAHLVGEAREAYDALSEEGKGYVTNLNLLQGAEGRLADLDAAIAVDQQILNIGTVTLEKEQQIINARTAYDALNANQNRWVLYLSTLEAAEARLAELKELAAYKTQVLQALGQELQTILPNYRQEQQQQIQALAQQGQTAIQNAESKEAVNTIVADLRAQLAQIQTKAQLDAQDVDNQIAALPANIALTDEDAIVAARTAYDALSTDAKALVTKLSVLEAAEARLAELKQEKANAEAVDEMINQIGQVDASAACLTKITNARNAYEALNAEEKSMVTGLTTLQAAEAEFATALAQAKDAGKASIDDAHDALNLNKYSKDNKALIEQLTADAKSAIDEAHSSDEIAAIISDYQTALANIPQKKAAAKKGCGGSIVATSVVLSTLALTGLCLLSIKKRKED